MASTTFSNGTVIPVDWLNEVNALLWGSASPPANPIRVTTNGNVGFGNTNPNSGIAVRIRRDSVVSSEADVGLRIDTSESAGGVGLGFGVSSATGIGYIQTVEPGTSYASKSLVLQPNNGSVGIGITPTQKFHVAGVGLFSGTGPSVRIKDDTSSEWGWQSTGGIIRLYDYTVNIERLRVLATGDLTLTSSGAKLGYGTGAGGTVTQATSKSTAVTLNTATGQITMNNAVLAGGATVSFTVNNSSVSVTDVIIVHAAGNGNYRVECASVSGGSFIVRVTNMTGGSLSDALGINFAVIKGSTT